MRHIYAMLIKFIVIAAALEVILGFLTTLSYMVILLTALLITGISYFFGDISVLARTNNITATVTDFVLSMVIILTIGTLAGSTDTSYPDTALAALAVAASEWVFHRFAAPVLIAAKH